MDAVHVGIAGAHEVGVRLDEFPDALHAALLQEIGALGEELLSLVTAATPDRTGKLRSEERLRIFDDPERIKAQVDVSAEAAKAAALEYGAHRATKVGAHAMRLDHAWGRRFAAPLDVLVAAYTRTPDIAAVEFERGPLADLAPEIVARLGSVVERSVGGANA